MMAALNLAYTGSRTPCEARRQEPREAQRPDDGLPPVPPGTAPALFGLPLTRSPARRPDRGMGHQRCVWVWVCGIEATLYARRRCRC